MEIEIGTLLKLCRGRIEKDGNKERWRKKDRRKMFLKKDSRIIFQQSIVIEKTQ